MEYNNQYIIPFKELNDGNYKYDFSILKQFFEEFKNPELIDGEMCFQVNMLKSSTFLLLSYILEGTVYVQCDRCLDFYQTTINTSGKLKVVFDTYNPEDDIDIITLNQNDEILDLSHFIYESIILNLPVQKIHPNDEKGESTCNAEMLSLLKKYSKEINLEIDPRWEVLKKLKNLN